MAYQILTIVDATKEGPIDLDSRRVVWDNTTYAQGLKFLNDGKTILVAVSAEAVAQGNATWDAVSKQAGDYSVLLQKTGGTDADGSIHLQFTPTAGLTLNDLWEAIDAGAPGNLAPVWSFYREESAVAANFAQMELLFEDPLSEGWLELTMVPRQGSGGGGGWVNEIIASTCEYGFGGRTPNGTSVFAWTPPLPTLATMLAVINAAWAIAEQGEAATTYALTRVRLELWEANPARTTGIDDVVIDGVTYAVEPGLADAEIGPNTIISTLEFVEVRDRFGRIEVLAPILGASQELIVGPLLPVLFNDSDGYTRFKPMSAGAAQTGVDFKYVAIHVTNPS